MKEKASPYARITAGICASIGLLLLASLLSYLSVSAADRSGLLLQPGAFLYKAFVWGSFYVPLYFVAAAALLMARPFRRDRLATLTLTILPFLTFVFLIKFLRQVEATPIFGMLRFSLGRVPGSALIVLLLVSEILLLIRLSRQLAKRHSPAGPALKDPAAGGTRRRPQPQREGGKALSEYDRVLPFLADGSGKAGNAAAARKESPQATPEAQGSAMASPIEPSYHESFPYLDGEKEAPAAEGIGVSGGGFSASEDQELYELEALEEADESNFYENIPGAPEQGADTSPSRGPGHYEAYSVPIEGILPDRAGSDYWRIDAATRRSGEVLMNTLSEFKITAELTGIRRGPVITMFEILPSPGVKLSRIVNLADNIALRLAASRVRIVAPIPGKHAVGIEVPNKERAIVHFKELLTLDIFHKSRYEIPVILGVDISGEAQIVDLVQTPHLLIAGATGSGKSVCVNSLVASILYKRTPEEVRLLMIDPKIVELKFYNDIPHLLTPVVTEPKHCFQALQYCLYEMERRYSLLDALEVRDIRSYNLKVKKNRLATQILPYIVIVIDEFADLMATTGKEMEATLARLAAMSRAVGLHLVLATQRPSVDVITGLIKANIPSRIAFMVASKFDSRIIIDTVGAEKLLGQGDMLFTSAWDPIPVRIQGAFLSEDEVEAITDHVRTLGEPDYIDEEMFFEDDEEEAVPEGEVDPLMDQAVDIVVLAGKASASYLQRRLKIGYNRAARLVENMELMGIVGPANGSKPREILHVPDRYRVPEGG